MNRVISLIKNLYLFLYKKVFREEKYAIKIGVSIGSDCRIYTDRFGSEPYLITIGNKVTISNYVTFITHDGSPWIFGRGDNRYYKYAKISVGNNVFIGMGCFILPGVTIGNNVVVGSGSVITKNLESNFVYAGNPARKIDSTESYKEKVENTFCHSSDYISVTDKYSRIIQMEHDYKLKQERD